MNNLQKNAVYSLVLIVVFASVYLYRQSQSPSKPSKNTEAEKKEVFIEGTTFGVVTYHIKYLDEKQQNYKKEIDSILQDFNQAFSTYIPDSEISQFNQSDSLVFQSPLWYRVLAKGKEVYEASEGAFDPTLAPIIEVWGFGVGKIEKIPDQKTVDSLKKFVGMDKINFDKKILRKDMPQMSLNFNAINQGYAVDVVSEFLQSKGIENYLVEIGREMAAKGKNAEGKSWLIGIVNPKYKEPGQDPMGGKVRLEDRALSTSGNYESFYVKNGKKYAHIIDPKTGYPVEHSLLSASVFAPDCITADAFATAFMVLGKDKTLEIVAKNKNLDVFLIYSDEKGNLQKFASEGIKDYFEK
ncbi:MAG: FAD:protein FMN transferase [Microscillaceae bacterium]|nr:FAD:protein FMN transferase [Microscillaceae bacterium]